MGECVENNDASMGALDSSSAYPHVLHAFATLVKSSEPESFLVPSLCFLEFTNRAQHIALQTKASCEPTNDGIEACKNALRLHWQGLTRHGQTLNNEHLSGKDSGVH